MAERKRKPTPTVNGVEIAPEKWTWQMAEEALAKNTSNRHIRGGAVDQYARLVTENMWGSPDAKQGYRASSQFVIFDWDGNLLDGQHRLYAQVQAKATMYHYVLRDVPPSTQHYIDLGIARTAGDALKFAGYANYIILSTVSRWSWLLEQQLTSSRSVRVSNDEVLDMVERHPDLTHSADMAAYAARSPFFRKILGPTPLGASHWWIAQHNDHLQADMFLDRFVRMNGEADGSAIMALWTRLSNAREVRENIQTRVQIAMIIKAWNLDCSRVYVQRISSKSRGGEYHVPDVEVRVDSQEDGFGPLPEAEEPAEEEEEVEEDETA